MKESAYETNSKYFGHALENLPRKATFFRYLGLRDSDINILVAWTSTESFYNPSAPLCLEIDYNYPQNCLFSQDIRDLNWTEHAHARVYMLDWCLPASPYFQWVTWDSRWTRDKEHTTMVGGHQERNHSSLAWGRRCRETPPEGSLTF